MVYRSSSGIPCPSIFCPLWLDLQRPLDCVLYFAVLPGCSCLLASTSKYFMLLLGNNNAEARRMMVGINVIVDGSFVSFSFYSKFRILSDDTRD